MKITKTDWRWRLLAYPHIGRGRDPIAKAGSTIYSVFPSSRCLAMTPPPKQPRRKGEYELLVLIFAHLVLINNYYDSALSRNSIIRSMNKTALFIVTGVYATICKGILQKYLRILAIQRVLTIQSLQLKQMRYCFKGVVLPLLLLISLLLSTAVAQSFPQPKSTLQERVLQGTQVNVDQPATSASNQFPNFDLANSAQSVSFGTVSDEVLTEQISNNQIVDSNTIPSQPQQPAQQNSNSTQVSEPTKTVPELEIGQVDKPIMGKGFKENMGISFQLIHLKGLDKKYLFLDLKLSEKDRWQKVNYTVTIQGTQRILLNCSYTQFDSCFIPKYSLKENVNIFVLISCEDDCTYNLRGRWSDLEHLKPKDDFTFSFGEEKNQLFHLELEGVAFEEIRIHLSPRTTRMPFDNAKIFGKYGFQLEPSSSNYDFASVNLWEDGQGVFLKKSLMKSMSVAILLVGQGETTYRLTCEAIPDAIHEVEINEHIYEYMQSSSTKAYHAAIPNLNQLDQFSFKISVFSGEMGFQFYSDKEMKTKVSDGLIRSFQLEYMKDSQLFITRRDIDQISNNTLTGFYIQAKTSSKSASFSLKYSARKYNSPVEMNEHVYSFIPIENNSRFAWFNFKHWASETDKALNLKFTTSVIQVAGVVTPTFFICKSTLDLCSSTLWANYTTPLKIMKKESLSEKTLFEFQIPQGLTMNFNSMESEAIVMVHLQSPNSKELGVSIIAIEFINNNKVLYLRENRPLEEKLFAGEFKIYKYINSDPNVKEIRVHLNHVEGDYTFLGMTKNEDPSKTINVSPSGSSLIFTKDLTLPLIITVSANTRSIYSISMQVIHKGEEETEVINSITIGEDLSYSVKILPMQSTVFEVVPIYYDFNFVYEASQTVLACLADIKTNMCVGLNETANSPIVAKREAITTAKLTNRRAHVKISNPSSTSIAEVRVIFHSRALGRCMRKKIGFTYHEVVSDKSCFQFLLDEKKKQSLEIYASKREITSYDFTVFLCGNSIKGAEYMKMIIINSTTISSHCSSSIEGWKVGIYWNQKTSSDQKQENVKVDMIVQYQSDSILLPEGVAYHSKIQAKGGMLKKFAFELINKMDTRVIINSVVGLFFAYAKIVNIADRDRQEVTNINFKFESRYDVDYKQEPIILIPASAIKEASCSECAIIIAVYSYEGESKLLEYEIEVVQRVQEISDTSAINGYLEANSSAYYTYDAHQTLETNFLFVLSDHNRDCANLYLGLYQFPGPGNNIASAEQDSILFYKHPGGRKTYFLTVQSKKVCEYTLSVVTSDSSIFKIERGKHYLIRLLKGNVQYFFFENGNEAFKIFAMNKFGDVKFYLKRSNTQITKRSFTSEQLQLKNFEFTGEHPNVLSIDSTSSIFCTNCHYILAVEALKSSFSTLVLAYPMSLVTLPENKFLSDELRLKNDILYLAYKRVEKTRLKVSVHKGAIEISAFYKTSQATQAFDAKSEHQIMVLDLDREVGKEGEAKAQNQTQHLPINMMIKAMQADVSYTIQATSFEEGSIGSADIYQDVAAGQPNHIAIGSEKVVCLKGYFRDENEVLVISVNHDNQNKLAGILLKAKINNIEANISSQIVKNLLNINLTYALKAYQGAAYELCLKYEQPSDENANTNNKLAVEEQDDEDASNKTSFNAIVSQDNNVNLLPSDTEAVVKGSSTFTIHHTGEFLLDVFQCKELGKSRLSYAKNLNDLQDSKSKSISVVSLEDQAHAIRLPESDSSTTYVTIKSSFSTVRWLPIDLESDEGTGYMKFSKGDLKYTSKFKYIAVQFQGLQNIKPTQSTIKQIDYSILISNDSSHIQELSNCDSSDKINVVVIPLGKRSNPPKNSQKVYYKHEIDKSYLEKHFSTDSNVYITVVAKLTLEVANRSEESLRQRNPSSDEHEHYRFIYNRQQMPLESYRQSQIESIPYHFIVVIVMSAAVLLLLFTYLCTRKIIPMLARLKNSNLVEDQDLQADKDAIEVPPSSDRNQRQPQVAVETEEKMGK